MVAKERETRNSIIASNSSQMSSNTTQAPSSSVWLVDSGCSNHMTGDRSLFDSLDGAQKISMRLGIDKEMVVEGVGTVYIRTQKGKLNQLEGVQFVPSLAHNLLSVGQLLVKGYSIVFNQESSIITDNHTRKKVIKIQKSRNNMFPVDVSCIGRLNVVVSDQISSKLWHS